MPRFTRLRDLEPRLPRVKGEVLTRHPFVLIDAINTTTEFGARWLITLAFVESYPEDAPRWDADGVEIANRYVSLLGRSESRDRVTRHFQGGGAPIGPVILEEVRTRGHSNRFYDLVDWEGEPDPLLLAAAGLLADDNPPAQSIDDTLEDAF